MRNLLGTISHTASEASSRIVEHRDRASASAKLWKPADGRTNRSLALKEDIAENGVASRHHLLTFLGKEIKRRFNIVAILPAHSAAVLRLP